jgi:CRISPR-associated protein Cmr2
MAGNDECSYSLIAFHIGPPQEYISYARSVRDLWSGSAIMSWLSFMAMTAILGEKEDNKKRNRIIFPVLKGTPHLKYWWDLKENLKPNALHATCIPNKFIARIPDKEEAIKLAESCEDAAKSALKALSEAVKNKIAPLFNEKCSDWDANWDAQVESYFEIRTSVIHFGDLDDTKEQKNNILNRIKELEVYKDKTNNSEWTDFTFLYDYIGKLQETKRSVKHFPNYIPKGVEKIIKVKDEEEKIMIYTPKCSVMGTYEQMGPADFTESAEFWKQLSEKEDWSSFEGVRIRSGERFSALSLTKRYAPIIKKNDLDGLKCDSPIKKGLETFCELLNTQRIPDTYTIAASEWLDKTIKNLKQNGSESKDSVLDWRKRTSKKYKHIPDPDAKKEKEFYYNDKDWNGSWLHMKDQTKEKTKKTEPRLLKRKFLKMY